MCSADYAFTVTDSLAGIKCIKTKKLTQLSAQQILDCSEQDCEMGSFEQSKIQIVNFIKLFIEYYLIKLTNTLFKQKD